MKGQAIVVTKARGVEVIPFGVDLDTWMKEHGYALVGITKRGGPLRPELQGQPRFDGLVGPAWGGEDHPLRYEDLATHHELSR